jgi:hypothetical protein
VLYFKLLPRYLPGKTEEIYKKKKKNERKKEKTAREISGEQERG